MTWAKLQRMVNFSANGMALAVVLTSTGRFPAMSEVSYRLSVRG